MAARNAAREGLDVLLIEKRQEIGEPVRCAEGLFKAGLDDFIDYDPKWVCAEIKRRPYTRTRRQRVKPLG